MKQRAQAWRDKAIKEMVDNLTDLGQRACRHAIIHREYDNKKFNLVDSIGSAVYIDGVLEPSTKRYAYSSEFSTEPYEDKGYRGTGEFITGRDAIDRYWDEHRYLERGHNTVELVVVAGTFYSGILESNGIQVISAAVDFLEDEMFMYKTYKPKLRAHADLVDVI